MCKLNAKSRAKFASVNAPLRLVYTEIIGLSTEIYFPSYKTP